MALPDLHVFHLPAFLHMYNGHRHNFSSDELPLPFFLSFQTDYCYKERRKPFRNFLQKIHLSLLKSAHMADMLPLLCDPEASQSSAAFPYKKSGPRKSLYILPQEIKSDTGHENLYFFLPEIALTVLLNPVLFPVYRISACLIIPVSIFYFS